MALERLAHPCDIGQGRADTRIIRDLPRSDQLQKAVVTQPGELTFFQSIEPWEVSCLKQSKQAFWDC
jgi:hypothetical protein